MKNQKNEYLFELIEDFAVLHNMYIREAASLKQIYNTLLGIQNALDAGSYDSLSYEEFQKLVNQDLEDIYDKEI